MAKLKAPYVIAIIHKDIVEQLPKTVPAHEVAILQAVHGEDKVTVDEAADLPKGLTEMEFEADEEYDRLVQLYGDDPGTKTPHVAMVYNGRKGFADAVKRGVSADDSLDEVTAASHGTRKSAKG